MAESSCACARWLKSLVRLRTRPYHCRHRAMRPACCALAHKALSLLPSCDATGMLCACAQGLIVVAIERRDRHVVRLRTRPYRRRHCATRPACRALAHEALSLSPSCDATGMLCACARGLIVVAIVQRDRHVVRLRTRPYCCCPSGDATGMSCACARGLIVVAIVRRDRHVVRLRTRPYCCRPSGNATGMSCACARGLIIVTIMQRNRCCRALAHEALSPLPLRDAMCQQLVRMRTRGSGDAPKAELGCLELG